MSKKAAEFWKRSVKALHTARRNVTEDPDAGANRAYYAAVHRDLVNAGVWPKELGAAYSSLVESRKAADYGGLLHVSGEEAKAGIRAAEDILRAVHELNPGLFALVPPCSPQGIEPE